jgi:type I restriction enzyme M protein
MNMMTHGVENPAIQYKDSLSDQNTDTEKYTMILANPPFKGSLDADIVAPGLLKVCKTKKTELLFLALFLRMLKVGGRGAVIVPDGVLFGSSKAHKDIRRELIENHRLEAVISMPSGVFKPYAGVSTAVLVFTKTGHGGTEQVWFYDMRADGFSLDDKRTAVAENDIPDIIRRFHSLGKPSPSQPAAVPPRPEGEASGSVEASSVPENHLPGSPSGGAVERSETERARTEQSFLVPKAEIVENGYDLSINKYKKTAYVPVEYPPTSEIFAELRALEAEIAKGLEELEGMV